MRRRVVMRMMIELELVAGCGTAPYRKSEGGFVCEVWRG